MLSVKQVISSTDAGCLFVMSYDWDFINLIVMDVLVSASVLCVYKTEQTSSYIVVTNSHHWQTCSFQHQLKTLREAFIHAAISTSVYD